MSEALGTISGGATDEAVIRSRLEEFNAAWDRGDADGFAALFSEDADYITFDGSRWKGRREIAESHRAFFQGFLKGSRLVIDRQSIRLLAPDVALIHTRGAVLLAGQKVSAKSRLSVQTLVAVKRPEGWRFVAFQNTRYRPFARSWPGRFLKLFGLLPPMPPDK